LRFRARGRVGTYRRVSHQCFRYWMAAPDIGWLRTRDA
jgi:hypothetical protein